MEGGDWGVQQWHTMVWTCAPSGTPRGGRRHEAGKEWVSHQESTVYLRSTDRDGMHAHQGHYPDRLITGHQVPH